MVPTTPIALAPPCLLPTLPAPVAPIAPASAPVLRHGHPLGQLGGGHAVTQPPGPAAQAGGQEQVRRGS